MNGAIPPLPNTPSWCAAQLKEAQGQLYLYLITLLEIYIRRNISVTMWKELIPTSNRICVENCNEVLYKVQRERKKGEKQRKKTENVHCLVTT
jgi:hypothetical protein